MKASPEPQNGIAHTDGRRRSRSLFGVGLNRLPLEPNVPGEAQRTIGCSQFLMTALLLLDRGQFLVDDTGVNSPKAYKYSKLPLDRLTAEAEYSPDLSRV